MSKWGTLTDAEAETIVRALMLLPTFARFLASIPEQDRASRPALQRLTGMVATLARRAEVLLARLDAEEEVPHE